MNASNASAGTLVDSAYDVCRRRILDNEWPPGFQHTEQEVALMLGVSRTPVREALVRLRNEGLIDLIPRHGMKVLPVSPVDMREIYQVLTALEGLAAQLLADQKPSRAALAPLFAATREMELALQRDDLEAWAAADELFHSGLIQLSGNQHLVNTVSNYWDRAHRARMFSLRLRPKPVNSTREHMALLERLIAGDAEGALRCNADHRARASKELLAIFESHKLAQM